MKRHFLKFSPVIFLSLAILISGNFSFAAMETTIEAIINNKDSYDGKEVSVSGTVSSPKFKASKDRKAYMTFPILGDSGGRINVLFWGDMKLKPGKKVSVRGIYRKILEMGKYTFRDVIEASEIETDMKKQEKNS